MSKLNASASTFIPGKGFVPSQPPPSPLPNPQSSQESTRPEPAVVSVAASVTPAPSITLNIGGQKSTPAAAHPPPKQPTPAVTKPQTSATFSLERSATDTTAIANEVRTLVNESVLKDLYGDGESIIIFQSALIFNCLPFYLPLFLVKDHLNIVFIGHVDAGKSTMGGNLLFITGMVDKRTMEKYEREAKEAGRESWYLSWALDSTPQERAKGKTVEVGRAYFETEYRRYTILDAPGHKNFVPSMISGAAQADVAILVISARKGEFETGFERGGQTREHIMLVKTAGVSKIVIVINKMDDSTVNWEKSRYDEIRDKLTPFVKAAGFNPKTDVTFLPVSAYTGANLKDRVSESVCSWYGQVLFFRMKTIGLKIPTLIVPR